MRKLLIATAERALRYLEGLNERGVAPDPTVVARLAELDIPLPDHPSEAEETLALLDSYGAATMAMAGPRFFGFVSVGCYLQRWQQIGWPAPGIKWPVWQRLHRFPRSWRMLRSGGCAMCSACRPKRVWVSSPARRWRISPAWLLR